MRVVTVLLLISVLFSCSGDDDSEDDASPAAATATPFATNAASPATATVSGTSAATPRIGATATATATRRAASPVSPSVTASPRRTESAQATATATTGARAPTSTPRPVATSAPTSTPTESTGGAGSGELRIVESGFGQREGDSEVGWGFVVENSSNAVIAESAYEIVAYDAAGTLLETDSSYIDYVLPGERLGIGGSLYLEDGAVVERLEFALTPGDAEQLSNARPFTTQRATYLPSDFFSSVSGIVSNPTERLRTDVYVWAVLYDAGGKIIGGGHTFLDVIPAGGSVPVEALVAASAEPERVDLYAALSTFSVDSDLAGLNEGSQTLEIIKHGWSATGDFGEVGWGFLVRNPMTDRIAEDISYVVAAYADDRTVLRVTSSFLTVLLPGETLGVGGSFFIDVVTEPASIEIQAYSRGSSVSDLRTIFATEDVAYVSDEFGSTVTGTIRSSHAADLDGIEVYAVCYNSAGDIIGGGFSYAGLIPAGGTAVAEVAVAVSEPPAMVELYATVSTFSGFLE